MNKIPRKPTDRIWSESRWKGHVGDSGDEGQREGAGELETREDQTVSALRGWSEGDCTQPSSSSVFGPPLQLLTPSRTGPW